MSANRAVTAMAFGVLWFVVLGGVGLQHIVQQPAILAALNIADESRRGRGPDPAVMKGGPDRVARLIDNIVLKRPS
mgnify:CR=1 FL=1